MQGTPLVSVIVVTLNNAALLKNCLASLFAQSWPAIEVIVVDNGSEEDIAGLVTKEFPLAKFLRFGENLGFAEGNNRGIAASRGEFVALINNDAVASPGWVKSLVEAAMAEPRAGAVASVIIDGNNPAVFDSCGMGAALDGMSRQVAKGESVAGATYPREVLMASGCACLYRRAALDEVGFFDPAFFAYCEDSDLGLRLQMAGWRCLLAQNAVVHHYYSMTFGRFSMKKVYWVERNHFWVFLKNYPLILFPLLPLATAWRLFLQAWYFSRGNAATDGFKQNASMGELAKVYLRAYRDMARAIPSMLGKRLKNPRRLGTWNAAMLLHRHRLTTKQVLGIR